MHKKDGMLVCDIYVKVVIVLLVLPLLLAGLTCLEASPNTNLMSRPHASFKDPVLIAGIFHYLDVMVDGENKHISIIAYSGDTLPEPENRSIKNYYRWEYTDGGWTDASGHDSSSIVPSKCTKENNTYSFCIRLSDTANPGSWTIKIFVDDKETASSSVNVIIGDFCLFFSTIIGVFEPSLKGKNSLVEKELIGCYQPRKMLVSEENIDKIVDEIIRKKVDSSKEEITANNHLDISFSNGTPLTKNEQVKSTVVTYPRSKLKDIKNERTSFLLFDGKREGGSDFYHMKFDGYKRFFVIFMVFIFFSASFIPVIVLPGEHNDSVDTAYIDVHSYPAINGQWTVMFTTVGQANLTITAVNGTTWNNTNENQDLKFLELRSDNETVECIWENESVFIANYSSTQPCYEISEIMTPGVHTLMFCFGSDIVFVNDLSSEYEPQTNRSDFQNGTENNSNEYSDSYNVNETNDNQNTSFVPNESDAEDSSSSDLFNTSSTNNSNIISTQYMEGEPYIRHYFKGKENSFGLNGGYTKEINWSYFWDYFHTHATWGLQRSVDGDIWYWVNESFREERLRVGDGSSEKSTFYITVSKDWYYRLVYTIDPMLQSYYDDSAHNQYLLNFSVGVDEIYTTFFNWSDITNLPGFTITPVVENNHFSCIVQKIEKISPSMDGQIITIDPSFGDTTQYTAAYESIEGIIRGINGTAAGGSGNADNITVALRKSAATGTSWTVKCALYDSGGNYIATTEQRTITPTTTMTWYVFAFSAPKPLILNGRTYKIYVWANAATGVINVGDTTTGAPGRQYRTLAYAASWPNPIGTLLYLTGSYSIYCSYTVDSTAPTSSVNAISPYWKLSSPQTLSGTASDTGTSGLKNVTLWYRYRATNASGWGGWVSSGLVDTDPWVAVSWSFPFSNGTGHYQFYSIARDNATNVESAPGSADAGCGYGILPTSIVNTITPYWKKSSPLAITATASNGFNGLKNVTLWYRYRATNASGWGGWVSPGLVDNDPWVAVSWSFTFPNGTGHYQFYSIARDNETNVESAPGSADAQCGYDTTAPASNVDAITPYWKTSTPTTITATATDALSGVKNVTLYYRFSNNNASWGGWVNAGIDTVSPWSWSFSFANNGTGYYQFYSIARDNATNVESVPGSADTQCGYDNTLPSSYLYPITPYLKKNFPLTITGTASDGLGGLTDVALWYRWSTDNTSWSFSTQYVESMGTSSYSTDTNWQTKTTITLNPSTTSTYVIISTAGVRVASTTVSIGARLTVAGSTCQELYYLPKDTTDWYPFNALKVITISNPTTINLDYKTYTAGTAATIREARIIVIKVPYEAYDEDEGRVTTTSATWQTRSSISVTPNGASENFIVIATANLDGSLITESARARIYNSDGTTITDYIEEPGVATTAKMTFGSISRVTLTQTRTLSLDYCSETSMTTGIQYSHIVAIPESVFNQVYYSYDDTAVSPAVASTWYTKVSNTYTPVAGEHLIIGMCQDRCVSTSSSSAFRLTYNGTNDNGYLKEDKDTTDYRSSFTMTRSILTATQKTDSIGYMAEATTATFKNARLYALELTPSVSIGKNWSIWSDAGNPDTSSPWSWNFNFPNGEGYYEFYSIARDNMSNAESAPSIADTRCHYLIDSTKPTSSVDPITPYWTKTNPITITVTASDDIGGSGLQNVTLNYYNSTNNNTWNGPWKYDSTNTTPWITPIRWHFTFPNGTGYYRFYSVAYDNATNKETFTGNDTWCGYDNVAPSSSVTAITPYWKTSSPLTITATASDTGPSGVKNVTLYYRYRATNVSGWGGYVSFGVDTASPWSWSFTFSNRTGHYAFYSIAKDNATNVESAPETNDTYCGYNHIPTITNPYPSNGSIGVSLTPQLRITINDLDGNIMTLIWSSNSSGSWAQFGKNNSCTNGTYLWTNTNFSSTGTKYYWRINVTDALRYNQTTYYFTTVVPPVIDSYDLRNASGSKLNNATGLLDVNKEYCFTINITDANGWSDIEYIEIKSWYDNGSDSTTYNNSGNLGGNLNMYLQYVNTTGVASWNILWPDDETQIILENCTETVIAGTTRTIHFSFILLSQIKWASSNNTWDSNQNIWNDPYSWNFMITVTGATGLTTSKRDEYGVYKFSSLLPEQNWVDVIASPGYDDTSSIVTITYASNYDFNMSLYFEENLTNETFGAHFSIANNVYILANVDLNDDITADKMFTGIGVANAIDIFNDSGNFHTDNISQTVDVQFNVYIPFGTIGGKYIAHVAIKIKND